MPYHSRRNRGNASQQTDDVAMLDLAAGEDTDVACINLTADVPPCDDSDTDDSECEPETSTVQIDLTTGVQWHRQAPKNDNLPLLSPPAPPIGRDGTGNGSNTTPGEHDGTIAGAVALGNESSHSSDLAQSSGITSVTPVVEDMDMPHFQASSSPTVLASASPGSVRPDDIAVPVNSNDDCRHSKPDTCELRGSYETPDTSQTNIDLSFVHCECSDSNPGIDVGTDAEHCQSETMVSIPEPSIDVSIITAPSDTSIPSDI